MASMNMAQALNSAMDVMLQRDPDVLVFGEDVGFFGGVFRVTEGLQQRYGDARVFDAPIAEGGLMGVAIGMGAYGLRRWSSASSPTISIPASTSWSPPLPGSANRSAGEFNAPDHRPGALWRRHLRRPDPQPEPGGPVHPCLRTSRR